MCSFSGTSPHTEHGSGSVPWVWPSENLVTTATRPFRWAHAGQLRSGNVNVRSRCSRRLRIRIEMGPQVGANTPSRSTLVVATRDARNNVSGLANGAGVQTLRLPGGCGVLDFPG